MAELILTDNEKASDSLLAWSDKALGKAVRFCITTLLKDEKESVFAISCGQILCAIASKANATELKIDLQEVTFEDKKLGNWNILVKKTKHNH